MRFGLPSNWVYAWYEDGRSINFSNRDNLTFDEAKKLKQREDKRGKGEIVRVTLETSNRQVLKSFNF